jgi:hypothetical protein
VFERNHHMTEPDILSPDALGEIRNDAEFVRANATDNLAKVWAGKCLTIFQAFDDLVLRLEGNAAHSSDPARKETYEKSAAIARAALSRPTAAGCEELEFVLKAILQNALSHARAGATDAQQEAVIASIMKGAAWQKRAKELWGRPTAGAHVSEDVLRSEIIADLEKWADAHIHDAEAYREERGLDWAEHMTRHQHCATALRAAAKRIAMRRAAAQPITKSDAVLRKALTPFAALLEADNGYKDAADNVVVKSVGTLGDDYTVITVGDLRRAAAALNGGG